MNISFPAILVGLTLISGLAWILDKILYSQILCSQKQNNKRQGKTILAKLLKFISSFFLVFFIVLMLRSFIVEPFRIPSGSMMPTLLIGDFILVNKYDYGLRLPVLNTKIIANKLPDRGDIVVFRYPEDPSIPFIKRVVGLPGDKYHYQNKILFINDLPVQQIDMGFYNAVGSGKMMDGSRLSKEFLHHVRYNILSVPQIASENIQGIVPEGQYFVLGDNRDNSKDSRYWGYVPEENLVGRAFMIWMNWDINNNVMINFSRIGTIDKQ